VLLRGQPDSGIGLPRREQVMMQERRREGLHSSLRAAPLKLVKKHLDKLRDGFELLNLYAPELTAEAIQAVREAANGRDHQAAQLREAPIDADVDEAIERVKTHLNGERPWRDIAAIEVDLQRVRDAYVPPSFENSRGIDEHGGLSRTGPAKGGVDRRCRDDPNALILYFVNRRRSTMARHER